MKIPNYKDARKRSKEEVLIRNFSLDNQYLDLGKNKKFFLKTYGCQMNEHDSENIKGMLNMMQFTETEDIEEADLILLNTCSIRENAHNKAFGMLGRIKHLKETNPNIVVGLCGCMAQEEGVISEILQKYRFLNFVFGTHNLDDLPKLVAEGFKGSKLNIDVLSVEGDILNSSALTTSRKQLIAGSADKVYAGNTSANLILESSSTPQVRMNNNFYPIYHTGNKPTASEIGAAPAGYGLGTTCTDKSGQNCNDILVTGFYRGSNMTNKPSGCTQGWIYLLVMSHDNSSWVRQVAYDFGTASQVHTRVKQNGS